MKKHAVWIIAAVLLIGYVIFGLIYTSDRAERLISYSGNKKVAMINIEGEIAGTRHILELLNHFGEMDAVKAIILRINSPGGGVGASQEVYRQVLKVREKGKVVVSSMSDMGASGAYYIAAASDKIYANPGTITGSIGVLVNFFNAEKLLDKIGVSYTTIKSGKFKDVGSFSRPTTEKEKAMLKSLVTDVLNQFVDAVIDNRQVQLEEAFAVNIKDEKKKRAKIKKLVLDRIADGRIVTGMEAKKLGLVDELGNIDDAIEGAAEMVGIRGRPYVISERKRGGLQAWINSKIDKISSIKEETGFSVKYLLK